MKTRDCIILTLTAVISAAAFTSIACWAIDEEFRQQDAAEIRAKAKAQENRANKDLYHVNP